MPNIPGATLRQQSPYAAKLASLEPKGATALALAALALLDAINAGKLVTTDSATPALCSNRSTLCRMRFTALPTRCQPPWPGFSRQWKGRAMAANTSPLPFFSAAGHPADFFTVCKGISQESALDGASMFLDTAISLASNPEELDVNAVFAVRHLAEIAKALVDTVVVSLIEARREADRAIAEGGQ